MSVWERGTDIGRSSRRAELANDDADDTAGDLQQRARASPHSRERGGGRACNHRHHLVQPLNHTEVRIPILHSNGSEAAAATEGDDRRAQSDDNDGCPDDRDLREVMVYGGGRWRDGEREERAERGTAQYGGRTTGEEGAGWAGWEGGASVG
uniref:OSJNBa0042L16.2 protein n=1 Tax=Oryza sativa subsp. japonica TaxID=39947 RepID=Q7X7D0_ORYSJ|nr:OSJNBa0042L16.2 [Oryza sativa Japonica Group]